MIALVILSIVIYFTGFVLTLAGFYIYFQEHPFVGFSGRKKDPWESMGDAFWPWMIVFVWPLGIIFMGLWTIRKIPISIFHKIVAAETWIYKEIKNPKENV